MPWLCQCGNGNLKEETPPPVCDLCGFDLWAHFGIDDSVAIAINLVHSIMDKQEKESEQ